MTVPICALLILALLLPATAAAEGFLAFYGGYAFTLDDDNADVKIDRPLVTDDAEFENSPLYGVRVGGWSSDLRYLGGALDISVLDPDGSGGFDGIDLDVFPISALLMARLPLLESDSHPQGRLQPYLAAGPSLFISRFELPLDSSPSKLKETSVDIGLDARLGASFLVVRDVGVFVEYRLTYFEPIYDTIKRGVSARVAPTLLTHGAQLGFTLYF